MRRLALIALFLVCAGPAAAEIYRWRDEGGREHFTQDLNQVPPRYRKQAEEAAAGPSPGASKVQRFSTGAPAAVAPSSAGGDDAASGEGGVYRIRVQRAGTGMLVMVRLNGTTTAPFLIDTGASDVLVPQAVAEQLGLETGPGARTKRYSTANGIVEHPVVMLRSVSLGGAVVEDVPASVSPNMEFGLLGLSYFNHFTYNIDAAAGLVTLQRNQLATTGGIRGGRSEAQWRAEYAGLRYRLAGLEAEYESKSDSKSRERQRIEAQQDELRRQLALLDAEADRARVPMAWRD